MIVAGFLVALLIVGCIIPSIVPTSVTIVSTIAGTGTAGYSGDNGQATSATIDNPQGVVIDSTGNLYFSDLINNRVRKIAISTGIITTFAGTGTSSYSGDNGLASSAALYNPNGLFMDTSGTKHYCIDDQKQLSLISSHSSLGDLYICDVNNNRVRKVVVSTNIISTVAGDGTTNYGGDNGQATSAMLCNPASVAISSSGKL